MAENDAPTPGADEPTPAPAEETVEQTVVANQAAPAAAEKTKFTDRLWNFRAMVAVALAALLLGGGAGAALAAVTHDDGPDHHVRFARWGDGPGRPGPFMGPGREGLGPEGLSPEQRQQFRKDLEDMRKDLKDMRRDMRDRMKKEFEEQQPTPTPSPSATPNG